MAQSMKFLKYEKTEIDPQQSAAEIGELVRKSSNLTSSRHAKAAAPHREGSELPLYRGQAAFFRTG